MSTLTLTTGFMGEWDTIFIDSPLNQTYNFSVEELPKYYCEIYGKDDIIKALENIRNTKQLDKVELKSINVLSSSMPF